MSSPTRIYLIMKVLAVVALIAAMSGFYFYSKWQESLPQKQIATQGRTLDLLPQREAFIDSTPLKKIGLDLKPWLGKVIYLNFWAHWCTPCLTEIPQIVDMKKRLEPLGLQVIFVNVDEEEDSQKQARAFIDQTKLSQQADFFEAPSIRSAMEMDYLPYHIVIDRSGRKALETFGDISGRAEHLEQTLRELLEEEHRSPQEP